MQPAAPLTLLPAGMSQREAYAQWAKDGAAYRALLGQHTALQDFVRERCAQ